MPIRNTHRIGDWLMLDDESGATHYRSQMRKIWNGTWRHKKMFETRQPQEFIKAKRDPKALRNVRPEPLFEPVANAVPIFIGETDIPSPMGPAFHLYDPGIGDMIVGRTFQIR